nr:NAD(P)H-hydrate dehydratase [uncultured Cellulosilyticum sp.]
MKLMTPTQMRKIDELATARYGIPSLLLMEQASYQVFKAIEALDENLEEIVIVCGPGNNGGDGLSLARQLVSWSKRKVIILMLASSEKLSADGKTYYEIAKNMDIPLVHITNENIEIARGYLNNADLIVDAIFGTGLTRKVQGIFAEIIATINEVGAIKICVDIPSGIDGTTGQVQGIAVKANQTITFAALKTGLVLYPAIDYVGHVQVVPIGIPQELINETETKQFSLEKEEMKSILPKRFTRSNKGTYGKIIIIGGQKGMSGAPTLASEAALKIGSGLVTAAVPESIHDIMEVKLTEVMTVPLRDEEGHIALEGVKQIKELISNYTKVAIGPGLGRSEAAKKAVKEVLLSDKPCVIDADGLYYVSDMLEILKKRMAPTILTPHPGEMARLTGATIEEILEHPIENARQFAQKNKVILVLKIERTVIADETGNIYISRSGNNGMAKGGSGDVLTGLITGLWAQNIMPIEATKLGVYIQSRAGDLLVQKKNEYSLLPSDIYKEGINLVIEDLVSKKQK